MLVVVMDHHRYLIFIRDLNCYIIEHECVLLLVGKIKCLFEQQIA
ncbi:unnamed protein product [Brugia timori]|uniref:Uncharacterized protein n=1 Tax=Brugia timori TaxID=42155 RepID=A0A3P7W925_9BILA|nr:unnamed protein product [Brugia timori]